ncbi:MAG: head maturation protease, ClpP-related [Saonia sp.]
MKKSDYKGYYNIVRNEATKTATIYIYGVIGGFDWKEWKFINTADTFLAEFKEVEKEADVINVKINSPGGNVWDGVAIFNALNNSEKTINTYNDGICYSMAALLLLAGDKSYGNSNSLFMLHNVISAVWGNAQEMRDEADVLDKYDEALGTAIENKLGVTAAKVKESYLNYKDNYYTAEEAKSFGFYDEILKKQSKNVPEDVKNMSTKDLIEHYAKMNFEEPAKTPEKTKNKNPLTMNKTYPKIEAALNKKFGEGDSSNGIFLSEDVTEQIEAHIVGLEGTIASESTARETAETSISDTATANQSLIDEVNTDLELSGDEAVTDLAGAFAALKNKITVLGEQPGATHTQTGKEEDDDKPHAYIDFSSPMYNN